MEFLTDFADQAVVLPVAAVVAAGLAVSGWWRGLWAWLACVAGMMAVMSWLKYICFACPVPFLGTGLYSPSGHTAASSLVYGGALLLLLRGRVRDIWLFAIPPVIAVFFGITRLAVHAHDVPEVVLGGAVGCAFAALLVWLAGPRPPVRGTAVAVPAIVALAALHGLHLDAESTIHSFAVFLWLPLPELCRA